MEPELDQVRRTAERAAYRGAAVLRARLGNPGAVRKKGPTDLVTEADTDSEGEIRAALKAWDPTVAILSEESGLETGSSAYRWVVDPLDGTVNYVHGIPFFAVSIAFARRSEVLAGVVLNPMNGELFAAQRDQGAWLNGSPIRVSMAAEVRESLLGTGFPYDLEPHLERLSARFTNCLRQARGVRRFGSAALDLCFVACGRLDGYWEEFLHPWDMAAGALVVREAGGKVSTLTNRPVELTGGGILATNGRIHHAMLALMEVLPP
jgi:myo-inositol-1(or 4)-monophosphatase